jgi:hypothetical protein
VYTEDSVPRATAILLLVVFWAGVALPLFSASSDTSVPECCRRTGKHHCMMTDTMPMTDGIGLRAVPRKCPLCPTGSTVARHPYEFATLPGSRQIGAWLFSQPQAKAQTEARYRIAYSRARQKRGPPSIL